MMNVMIKIVFKISHTGSDRYDYKGNIQQEEIEEEGSTEVVFYEVD